MNIRQLETFLAIVEHGSFATAAEKLNATTSTISARIQELEESLGVILFDRSQRKIRLTPKGRELCRYAEKVTSAVADIKTFVTNADMSAGLLRLGVAEMIAVTWLPRLVDLIHEQFPKLSLELNVSLTAELLRRMHADEFDLILAPGLTFDANFETQPVGSVRFAWMAGRRQELPDRVIEPADLKNVRILSLGKDSFHHHTVQQWLTSIGGAQTKVDLCDSMDVIASLTREGVGISLLPVKRYMPDIESGHLRLLRTKPSGPNVEFFAIYRSSTSTTFQARIAELARDASTFDFADDQSPDEKSA
ncbi:HTH-type transcriptional regulator YofA [Afipia felis]|uniref:HTH-type transcriptional regulator YofA n=3 Tax=Afipia felis TaxID=1035 RepID=A0A380W2G1_AFIFE|nr:hypothetical protein HMPREF9697_02849 [Afipia felis ATCC 53690]SUU75066.1 HTH-type transcriptional regulator YofA [Afipia felis]SUU83132.1 HTH-type transcriptional regulator YofA [Afipia felis]